MHAYMSVSVREKKYLNKPLKHLKCHMRQLHVSVAASACHARRLALPVVWHLSLSSVVSGGTMSVILDLSYVYSIVVSSVVAIIYTLLGGLYSVAYTDVIQLILIFISLVRTHL